MNILITVNQKGARVDTIEKLLTAALKDKFPEVRLTVECKELPSSRPDRFQDALGQVSEAKSEIESLRDELQDWHDNLPENLQSGSKADELDEAAQALEEVIDNLDSAENADVTFPGMY